jgi:hypothetical protein
MLSIILISVALVVVIFAIANKKAKVEEPTIPTIEEEPLGYETSSFAAIAEIHKAEEVVEEPLVFAKPPAKKPKKKMSAKPKAPKKKKDA